MSSTMGARDIAEPQVPKDDKGGPRAGRDATVSPVHLKQRTNDIFYKYGVIIAWVVLIIVFGALRPSVFLTTSNFGATFGSQASLIVLALALTFALSVGEFDLSVASVMGLGAAVAASLNVFQGWNPWLSVLTALLCCAVVGAINAFLVVKVRINNIVVTLGTGTFVLGVNILVTQQVAVGGISPGLLNSMGYHIGGTTLSFWYAIAITILAWYVMRLTPLGRKLLFVGQNPEVSRLAGLNVTALRVGTYLAASILSGFAGIMLLGSSGGFLAGSTQLLLLPAFAASFLGASTLQPGRFNAWGTTIAVLFLATGITGLQLLGLEGTAWISQLFYGGSLVAAVAVSTLMSRYRTDA